MVFGDKFEILEQNRFTTEVTTINNKQRINIKKLQTDIKEGIEIAINNHPSVTSIGIDTWAVDFAAIDFNGKLVDDPMFYRDQTFVDELKNYDQSKPNALRDLYMETGLQIQSFNTMFQLRVLEKNYDVSKISTLLMLPDYLNYFLTNVKNTEQTNFSTTQLFKLNGSVTNEKAKLFSSTLSSRKLAKYKGLDVISVASHDTASAYASIPIMDNNSAFLSSGTWSLLGISVKDKIITEKGFLANFSNELNYDGTYRFQKNILGMWVINNLMKEFNIFDYVEIEKMVLDSKFNVIIDINNERFFNPKSMSKEIVTYCIENNLEIPISNGDIFRAAYNSLASLYQKTIEEIEEISNKKINKLVIVGGGAKSKILNSLISEKMEREIYIIPKECTIIGNALVQAIITGKFTDLQDGHDYLKEKINLERLK